jgi:hypothetical protein
VVVLGRSYSRSRENRKILLGERECRYYDVHLSGTPADNTFGDEDVP